MCILSSLIIKQHGFIQMVTSGANNTLIPCPWAYFYYIKHTIEVIYYCFIVRDVSGITGKSQSKHCLQYKVRFWTFAENYFERTERPFQHHACRERLIDSSRNQNGDYKNAWIFGSNMTGTRGSDQFGLHEQPFPRAQSVITPTCPCGQCGQCQWQWKYPAFVSMDISIYFEIGISELGQMFLWNRFY